MINFLKLIIFGFALCASQILADDISENSWTEAEIINVTPEVIATEAPTNAWAVAETSNVAPQVIVTEPVTDSWTATETSNVTPQVLVTEPVAGSDPSNVAPQAVVTEQLADTWTASETSTTLPEVVVTETVTNDDNEPQTRSWTETNYVLPNNVNIITTYTALALPETQQDDADKDRSVDAVIDSNTVSTSETETIPTEVIINPNSQVEIEEEDASKIAVVNSHTITTNQNDGEPTDAASNPKSEVETVSVSGKKSKHFPRFPFINDFTTFTNNPISFNNGIGPYFDIISHKIVTPKRFPLINLHSFIVPLSIPPLMLPLPPSVFQPCVNNNMFSPRFPLPNFFW